MKAMAGSDLPSAGNDAGAVELKLREREEMFRQVVENILEVFWMTDAAKTRMLYISPGYERIWGRACAELYANPQLWAEAIHPEDRTRVLDCVLIRQVAGKYDEQYRIVRPDGAVRWVHSRAFPVKDGDGKVTRIVGIAEDITERKWTEDLLRKSETEFRVMFESAAIGMALVGPNARPLKCNRALQRMLAYTEEELRGMTFMEFTHPEDVQADLALYRDLLAGKLEYYQIEKRYLRKDRKIVSARLTVSLVRAGVPGQVYAISLVEDLSEKKKLETQFQRAQRMEGIGTLAASLAHDLNNVLSPILVSSRLLPDTKGEADSRRLTEVIRNSAERGVKLVEQMLAFARGGAEQRRERLLLGQIIREIAGIIRETFPPSIHVQTRIAPDLWMVFGDPTQFHRVLLNLCINARDAMPAGGELTLSVENIAAGGDGAALPREAGPGAYVLIRVTDTGMGIDPDQQDKIFEPFYSTKEPGKGTGLGLSIVRGIIKEQGGFIHLRSAPGTGTTLELWLPAHPGTKPMA